MLSDLSVRRPVLATVLSLVIIAFGAISYFQLPLRELPDVDRPVVSVDVSYRGASAQVVERQVTRVIEDQLSGIDGVDIITSTSRDGRASVDIEFDLNRDLEDAANDVRSAVARARDGLPLDAEEPEVEKTDADADPIIWLNLQSTTLDQMQLSDYAERFLIDRLSIIDGVATVRIGGERRPSLRIWLDPNALAARGLTVVDVERALRAQNLELPAGQVEGAVRDYSVRVERPFQTPEEFARLGIAAPGGASGATVRLGDIARIELAASEERRLFRGNGVNQIGLGVVRKSKANALGVGSAIKSEIEEIRKILPPGTEIVISFDSTVFVEQAVKKVWEALAEALIFVVLVIFLFLGSVRAAAIPAAVIPVCLIGAFAVLAALGYSINLLTLMALVLAIGLVVDDSIVVLENVQRRMDQYGEPAPVAALRGTRQVFFAVVATSAVLIAVFTPFLFVGGYIGRLFIELAATVAGVVAISALVALTLTPAMCSKLLRPQAQSSAFSRAISGGLDALRRSYRRSLEAAIAFKPVTFALFALVIAGGWFVFQSLPQELTPQEDRGGLGVSMQAPEGAGFQYSAEIMAKAEDILMEYVETGEVQRVLIVVPGFGSSGSAFNSGFARIFLTDWDKRERSGQEITAEINRRLSTIPGAVFRAGMSSAFSSRSSGGEVSIVLAGADYATMAEIGERIVSRARTEAPGLIRPRTDYEPNSPRVLVSIDRERAAALGLSVEAIGRTLEATMGVRRVSTYSDRGEEYDVLLQAERSARSELADLKDRYVRSDRSGELIPLSSVVRLETVGDAAELRRVNRLASVRVRAAMAPGYTIGEALAWMEGAAIEEIAGRAVTLDYVGDAKEFRDSTGALVFTFAFALIVVFLVLAAQFESFVHPLVIMLSVPLAIAGGVAGLALAGSTLNIYSQIGLIILIALAAKNGILIVEFANQLRDQGLAVRAAILEASELRLRPILMTSVATVIGALPLVLSTGPGAESRATIGVVIVAGVTLSTLMTIFVTPVFYDLLARFTRSPEAIAKEIEAFDVAETKASGSPG